MSKHTSNRRIIANEYTTQVLKGREYLVVPGVIVQEQVMNHYYVPAEELAFAETWNGTPITVRHPTQNHGSANVPEPDVAVIGRFFNAEWDEANKRVIGEYWIDIAEAVQYVEGQYIINAVYSNNVLETSTGYWAQEEYSEGTFNGRDYVTIQHNLKPDHIAILVDEIGACSVMDGCGVNRNSLLHNLYQNVMELNGGPGSGYWGHLGRPGQVGGAAPSGRKPSPKQRTTKKLAKGVKAYYVAGKGEVANKKNGFKTRVSLMGKAKAAALFDRMTKGGSDPAILEVDLKAGTPYISLTSTSITVRDVPGANVHEITFETLQKRKQVTFTNAADCDCTDIKTVVDNEESITQRVEAIRKAFYEEFMQGDELLHNAYIRDYFEGYCIVEMGSQLYKVNYTEGGDGYTFDEVESWKKVAQEYVEQNGVKVNVLGDLPARAKKIWEKVYDSWLEDHPKDKEGAAKRAWGAVKQAGWKKVGDTWVKKNTVVKGVETVGTRKLNNRQVWTVTNNHKPNKEKQPMTLKMKAQAALEALRKFGLKVNDEDVEQLDTDAIIEIEPDDEDDEEEDDKEDETEQNRRTSTSQPQFNAQEAAALRKLLKVDFDAIGKLASQLPTVMEIAQNAETERATKKAQLIANIKAAGNNPFTDEELGAMSLPVLTKLNNQNMVDYSGFGTSYDFNTNMQDDEDVLAVPAVLLNTEEEEA